MLLKIRFYLPYLGYKIDILVDNGLKFGSDIKCNLTNYKMKKSLKKAYFYNTSKFGLDVHCPLHVCSPKNSINNNLTSEKPLKIQEVIISVHIFRTSSIFQDAILKKKDLNVGRGHF